MQMSSCRCLEHGGLTQSAEVIFNTIAEIGSMKLDDRGVVVRTYDSARVRVGWRLTRVNDEVLCPEALKQAVKKANTFPCTLSFKTVPDSQDPKRLYRLDVDESEKALERSRGRWFEKREEAGSDLLSGGSVNQSIGESEPAGAPPTSDSAQTAATSCGTSSWTAAVAAASTPDLRTDAACTRPTAAASETPKLNRIFATVLLGCRDSASPLYLLR